MRAYNEERKMWRIIRVKYWREFNTLWSIEIVVNDYHGVVDPIVNKINNIFIFILKNTLYHVTIMVDGKMINHDVVINLSRFHKKKYY